MIQKSSTLALGRAGAFAFVIILLIGAVGAGGAVLILLDPGNASGVLQASIEFKETDTFVEISVVDMGTADEIEIRHQNIPTRTVSSPGTYKIPKIKGDLTVYGRDNQRQEKLRERTIQQTGRNITVLQEQSRDISSNQIVYAPEGQYRTLTIQDANRVIFAPNARLSGETALKVNDNDVRIQGGQVVDAVTGVEVSGNSVTIESLQVKNSDAGIIINSQDTTVRGTRITDTVQTAISVSGTTTVTETKIEKYSTGVIVEEQGAAEIRDTVIQNGRVGIESYGKITVQESTIQQNTVGLYLAQRFSITDQTTINNNYEQKDSVRETVCRQYQLERCPVDGLGIYIAEKATPEALTDTSVLQHEIAVYNEGDTFTADVTVGETRLYENALVNVEKEN